MTMHRMKMTMKTLWTSRATHTPQRPQLPVALLMSIKVSLSILPTALLDAPCRLCPLLLFFSVQTTCRKPQLLHVLHSRWE